MVPTSTSRAPARAMMSGRRNEPPISISSPRETIASLPAPKVLSTSSTAAALLLTTAGVLGAGQLADQAAHVVVALAARAAAEVELERHGRAHGIDRGRNRALRQHGAAEVGVQHRAGEVEHAAQARRVLALQQAGCLGRNRGCIR